MNRYSVVVRYASGAMDVVYIVAASEDEAVASVQVDLDLRFVGAKAISAKLAIDN